MAKKVSLRVLDEGDEHRPAKTKPRASSLGKRPSIEAARQRLGGRLLAEDSPPHGLAIGLVVAVADGKGAVVPGVVVFASATEIHVLLDGVRLRRVLPDHVRPYAGEVSLPLAKLVGDAQLFARLVEGEIVRYAGEDGSLTQAKVVEKCRWGALVARDDGAIIAVGFRKLWPVSATGEV